jgi:hypothetical protein
MRLQYSVEAQRLLPLLRQEWSKTLRSDTVGLFAYFGYGSDHHFDQAHFGSSTEMCLSAESLFLKKTGHLWTSLYTLPMSGGSRAMSVLSDPAATVMIFPLTDDLVQRQGEQGF